MSTCTFDVTVQYNFNGFLPPIANLPGLNQAVAGSVVPLKFSLDGDKGLNIFAAGYPVSSQLMPCSSSAELTTGDSTSPAGNSGLNYTPSIDQYTYAWSTQKAWKNSCRQLIMKLNDGTYHRTNFRFK